MNIKITHSWLLDYLETDATPLEIQKYLSLCGPSIERIEKVDGEIVYDIEITSNRIDTASVLGIAREAAAILPMFGKKAVLKKKNTSSPQSPSSSVAITITDPDSICRRVLGIVMDVDTIVQSPSHIAQRLQATDMRPLNNVVDITNYVMTEIGHPTHVFDYDRITTHKLILRYAKKGEEIITLDEKKYLLDEQDVVIDDGTGKVIDLPGIMGTANSVVTKDTKRILFFIESNDPVSIRRTSMKYGIRTMASTINEKNPDSELAFTAFLRGIQLFTEVAGATPVSSIIDIYPRKQNEGLIQTSKTFIDSKVGVEIPLKTITSILSNLGFVVKVGNHDTLSITVPTYRVSDVTIPEDIVEEVARVYGYFALPSILQPPAYVIQPKDTELLFHYQYVIKSYLKHKGYSEVMNYSAVSKELLQQCEMQNEENLFITNSISEDIKYLRLSLIPSLVKNIKQNEGFKDQIKIFEIAKTYIPQQGRLPLEEFKFCIAVNTTLEDLKQAILGLFDELNISVEMLHGSGTTPALFLDKVRGTLSNKAVSFGSFGQIKPVLCRNVGIEKRSVYTAELSFKELMNAASLMPDYKSFSQYAHISRDITIKTRPYSEIKNVAMGNSKKLVALSPLGSYKDTITLRLEFTDHNKNITESEVKEEIEEILSALS